MEEGQNRLQRHSILNDLLKLNVKECTKKKKSWENVNID